MNYFIFLGIDYVIKLRIVRRKPGTLLLIKLEAIGDYILFRNYIPFLRESRFKDYKITFCGSNEIKALATAYDSDKFDDFIWIDREKFLSDIIYKYRVLRDLYGRGFEIAVNAGYTREVLFGDQMIQATDAARRIGSTGSPDHKKNTQLLTDRFYTELLEQQEKKMFEFKRNREFFELLLKMNVEIKKPTIEPLSRSNDFELDNYVLLFPGSKEEKRKWSTAYFAEVGNYILENSSLNLVIEGTRKEKNLAQEIIKNIRQRERVTDLTGMTSVSGLVKTIAGAEFLITNDSAGVHMASGLGVRFVCVSNGSYYNRFNPYPPEIYEGGVFVYPDGFNEKDFEGPGYGSVLDINSVRPGKVIEVVEKMLGVRSKEE
jgi:ADP-heptose:LPS heptosyltransferase